MEASIEWLSDMQVSWPTCLTPLVLRLRGLTMQVIFFEPLFVVHCSP